MTIEEALVLAAAGWAIWFDGDIKSEVFEIERREISERN